MEEDACLLATELVTNGLLHGGGPLAMTVSVRNQRLRIAVSDSEPRRKPRQQQRGLNAEGGRGLTLVDAIAEAWGVKRVRWHRGKIVWCELAIDRAASPVGLEPS